MATSLLGKRDHHIAFHDVSTDSIVLERIGVHSLEERADRVLEAVGIFEEGCVATFEGLDAMIQRVISMLV